MKKWYDGLKEIQAMKAKYKPNMFFSGYGSNGRLDRDKPTNMVSVNGQQSMMHEGEIATDKAIVPADQVKVLSNPARTAKEQKRLEGIQNKYGLAGYVEGYTPIFGSNNIAPAIENTINSVNTQVKAATPSPFSSIDEARRARETQYNTNTPTTLPAMKHMGYSGSENNTIATTKPIDYTTQDRQAKSWLSTTTPNTIKTTPDKPVVPDYLDKSKDRADDAADRLKDISTYNDPYYRNLANREVQSFLSSGASSMQALNQTLASTPGMTDGAKNAAMASLMRDIGSGESELRGSLAATAQGAALDASKAYADMSRSLVELGIDEKKANAIIEQDKYKQNTDMLDGYLSSGDLEGYAKKFKEVYGIDIDVTDLQDVEDISKADVLIAKADKLLEAGNAAAAGYLYAAAAKVYGEKGNISQYITDEFNKIDWSTEENQKFADDINTKLGRELGTKITAKEYQDYKLANFSYSEEEDGDLSESQLADITEMFAGNDGLINYFTGDGEGATKLASAMLENSGKSQIFDEMIDFFSNPDDYTDDEKEGLYKMMGRMFGIMYKDKDPISAATISDDDVAWAKEHGYNLYYPKAEKINDPDNIETSNSTFSKTGEFSRDEETEILADPRTLLDYVPENIKDIDSKSKKSLIDILKKIPMESKAELAKKNKAIESILIDELELKTGKDVKEKKIEPKGKHDFHGFDLDDETGKNLVSIDGKLGYIQFDKALIRVGINRGKYIFTDLDGNYIDYYVVTNNGTYKGSAHD